MPLSELVSLIMSGAVADGENSGGGNARVE